MSGEHSECIKDSSHQKPKFLTLEAVKKLTVSPDAPQGIVFPKYNRFELFRSSQFLQDYYNLGEQALVFSPDNQTLQILGLDEDMHYIMHLQRMLIILGYMDVENFSGNYCDRDPENTSCDRTENKWRYLGVFGNKTQESIKTFQTDYDLAPTGKVDEVTKETLYRLVYEHFHSSEKQECISETKGKIMNFQ